MTKLCVVVPAYNEAENLPKLIVEIEKALRGWDFKLVIVDDNSPDKSARVAEKLNHVHGNIIVRRRAGKFGLGSAVVEGLKIALAMDDVDRIVTLDADLSHSPSEIPKLLSAAEKTDIVQGSRYVENGSTNGWRPTRRLVSRVANWICRFFFGTFIHEYTSNFRVYSRECAETIVNCTSSNGYEWVVEALFVATRHGFAVREVPIAFRDRDNGKTKLKALDVVSWAFFVTKTLFSNFPTLVGSAKRNPSLVVPPYPTHVIHRSSTSTVTSTGTPIVSTTTYTLSSMSPGLSDHARSMNHVKSNE